MRGLTGGTRRHQVAPAVTGGTGESGHRAEVHDPVAATLEGATDLRGERHAHGHFHHTNPPHRPRPLRRPLEVRTACRPTTGREFLIIVDGTATVRRQGRVVATLGTGDFVGELSMLAGVPRTATVTADTDLTVEALNRREFASLLDQNPRLARKVMVGAIRRLHAVDHGPAD
jgi:hypothetical protein